MSKVTSTAIGNKLSALALGAGRASATTGRSVVDIITFIEAPWGLGMRLFPAQRVILKAYYGVALDDNPFGFPLDTPIPKTHPNYDRDLVDVEDYYKFRVVVTDWRKENAKCMTEAAYLLHLHSQGRCNIAKVVVGTERREMILSVGRRSGKCVVGNTLVLTDNGIFPIQDLGDKEGPEVQPLDVGVAQETGGRSRSAFFYNGGVRDTYQIQGYTGSIIEGTGNHRIKVLTETGEIDWCRLDEIQPNMYIAVDRRSNLWATNEVCVKAFQVKAKRKNSAKQPDVIDTRWGLLLGYLVGDGSWTNKASVVVTAEHPETIAELQELMGDLGGKVSWSPDRRTKGTGMLRTHDVALRAFLHNIGFNWNAKSDDKCTPWVIFRSPRHVVQAYLQGLFETDGSVTANGKTVSFSSASKRLAEETRVLLLNFGIVSRIRILSRKQTGRPYYEVVLLGLRSRQQFASEIGFRSAKKQNRLCVTLNSTREGGDTESIPFQKKWITKVREATPKGKAGHGWSKAALRSVLGNIYKLGPSEDLTYSRIRALLPVAEKLGVSETVLEHFRDILKKDYFYDPVISISQNQAPVFDLSVPDGAMFIANGLVNHNTAISACIAAYETYRLISKGDPHSYYGFPQSNTIQLISFATDKDQAGLLYQEVSGHFRNCAFFTPYAANNTQTYARFQTPKDIEKYGSYQVDDKAKAGIKVTFRSSVAKGSRGASNSVVILDEMAHFTDNGQSSADEVYKAVVPSTATFTPKNPKDKQKPIGPIESKILAISSPLGRQGAFYKLFQDGFKGGKTGDTRLCIQAPTWEVNPTIPADVFESEYLRDPRTFFTEFGAEFTDRTMGWLDGSADLIPCINLDARPKVKAAPRMPHFMGIDVALVGDASAIAIGHMEENKIVLDLVDTIQAGVGLFLNQPRLEFSDVVDWIYDYTRKFYITAATFDQWAGIPFEQALQKKGLKHFEMVHGTPQLNSQMYQNFKDMMFDKRLSLYNWPIEKDKEFCPYIEQLLELQAEFKTKYVTLVHAPKIAGKHDDMADALIRMVWLASQNSSKPAILAGATRSGNLLAQQASAAFMRNRRRAFMSGSTEERQIPKKTRGPSRFGGFR